MLCQVDSLEQRPVFVRLIAIAKDEGAYLSEWIHHHLEFGFDQISIILNDCSDNSHEILSKISRLNASIFIRDGDPLKAECLQDGRIFQIAAYNQELEFIQQDSRVTHCMCLDIDEFWIPLKPDENIKTYAANFKEADSISFLWGVEVPSHQALFCRALANSLVVELDRHVKSLIKVSQNLICLEVHNALFHNGVYVVACGQSFPEYIENEMLRAKIPDNIFNFNVFESAFIYHRIFRSETEYLASLVRGRPNGHSLVLKNNRWGYISNKGNECFLTYNQSTDIINTTAASYFNFIRIFGLQELIDAAQSFLLKRAELTLNLFLNPTPSAQSLVHVLRGLREVDKSLYPIAIINFRFDSITKSGDGFLVDGWVVDEWMGQYVEVTISLPQLGEVSRHARQDLDHYYSGSHQNNGFLIKIHGETLHEIKLIFSCGNYSKSSTLQTEWLELLRLGVE